MGKSSKDKRDAYYRLAKEQGWRARSAFKLLQLDEEFDLFKNVTRVVDLCAAPGSWSQVLSRVLIKGEKFGRTAWEDKERRRRERLHELLGKAEDLKGESEIIESSEFPSPRNNVKIVAIDLQPMSPLEGIITLRADITHPATVPLLLSALDSDYSPTDTSQQATHPVDLVICDGAPDVTGLHDLDIYIQSQLLYAALNLTLCVLKPGGNFVAKIFRGRNVTLLFAQLKLFFERVVISKPRSSRASSIEAFVVCLNYSPIPGFKTSLSESLGVGNTLSDMVQSRRRQHPIIAPAIIQNHINGTWECNSPPWSIEKSENVTEIVMQDNSGWGDTRWIAPFLACGDLGSWDADASYHLPRDRVSLDPIQPPTAPPYKRALEMRKLAGGAYGKTNLE